MASPGRTETAELARVLESTDAWILSDEVYSEMVYDGEHDSVARYGDLLDRTILVDGFSKTFAMTGWRLGYAVGAGTAGGAADPPDRQHGARALHRRSSSPGSPP